MAGLDVAAASVKPYPNVEDRKTGCSMIESFLKTEVFRSFCFGTAFSVHRSCSFYSLFILCLFSFLLNLFGLLHLSESASSPFLSFAGKRRQYDISSSPKNESGATSSFVLYFPLRTSLHKRA